MTITAYPAKDLTHSAAQPLRALLRDVFGHTDFRPHQENVCTRIVAGASVLLVMPTGAGKSLCYQLPGLARGGTTLVISPLIALMEDQVDKLNTLGMVAERIHSGRSREQQRQASRMYLQDKLHFLFIAPERLRVNGFPAMLAKRPPTLVAIDEAHCISQWGHDFRPDYRMIGERLLSQLSVPVVAMTATATQKVQDDIVEQLALPQVERFIFGFRRHNLAIEVVEMLPSQRLAALQTLLLAPQRLPAIVYTPTRKDTELYANALGRQLRAAAYHAGMSNSDRDAVQSEFAQGNIDVVVATIAFGMGIDKANIRSVVHTALPGSIEGYYQEIGRAGRDGLPAKAVLLHSFGDRRTHEFFFERDYPESNKLAALYRCLDSTPRDHEQLQLKAGLDEDYYETILEKLWLHGGAVIDAYDLVSRGVNKWREPYEIQRAFKLEQLDHVSRYVATTRCRMLQLVDYFGDQDDDGSTCGLCDVCDVAASVVAQQRGTTASERSILRGILLDLAQDGSRASGALFRDNYAQTVERNQFEAMLGALTRAGFLKATQTSFVKGTKEIHYTKLAISAAGARALQQGGEIFADLKLLDSTPSPKTRIRRQHSRSQQPVGPQPSAAESAPHNSQKQLSHKRELDARLTTWRLEHARRLGIPAFRIMSNRVLQAIAEQQPRSEQELLALHGVGAKLLKKYGHTLLEIVADVVGQRNMDE